MVCSHCGYEAASFERCPLCGTAAVAMEPGNAGRGAQGGDDGAQSPPPPWEDDRSVFPRSFIDTWTTSVLRPTAFFKGAPHEAAAAKPVLYYLIISIIGATFSLWWTAVFETLGWGLGGSFDPWGVPSTATSALLSFFATPFIAIFGLIMWSGLLHAGVMLFSKDRRSLRATVRVACYGSGPGLLGVVPILGALIGFFWSLAVVTTGLREAHRMSLPAAVGTVALAVSLPLALVVGSFIMLVASFTALA